jgi:Pyruvate/2-oxoacid:ferredoxin oxidoreductase gamma subunit
MFEGPIAASSDYVDLLLGSNWQEIFRHKEIL